MGEIATALISVYEKTGLDDLAKRLRGMGIKIIASGGTGAYLAQAGIECEDISEMTGKTELLGGLVKTLHPGIHAGILADRANQVHMAELASLGYEKIDMVVVNFYAIPEATGRKDLSFIDIGGPAMARAAAKNFRSCVPVPHQSWYEAVAGELEAQGAVGEDLRWKLATDTIRRTGAYDSRSLNTLGLGLDSALGQRIGSESMLVNLTKSLGLRYGENPHQEAGFFTTGMEPGFRVLKGELSYNNILDLDCCIGQVSEFDGKAAAIIKHVGPCGVAEAGTCVEALERAYACDPVSAFGGVIGVNFIFDKECADFLGKRFVECIGAPEFDERALGLLGKKKVRLVTARMDRVGLGESDGSRTDLGKSSVDKALPVLLRSALGGVLFQARDSILLKDDVKFVSGERPPDSIFEDLVFAWKVAKHVRSNAIVFAKGRRTLGIGAGQPSRVDSTKLAIMKAAQAGHGLKGSVMASDGFFPFPDCVELAAQAGACAVIQPGGSIRDDEVIEVARRLGITMAVTSVRHFRH